MTDELGSSKQKLTISCQCSVPVGPSAKRVQAGNQNLQNGARAPSSLPSSTPGLTPDALQDSSTEHIDISPGFSVSMKEADAAIRLYRTAYMPYFPFVPIPVTMTAAELHDSAPFFARTLLQMTVPAPASVQKEAQRFFRQQLAQHVVVNQERRLELLQAILVFVAWGNFHFYIESQATDLLQLAVALVVDLGLDQSPDSIGPSRLSFLPTAIRKVKGFVRQGHTQDDRRAMLGCFYLNSVTGSSVFFTPYLTYCCDKLLEMQEYESDPCLVALVRIQQILLRVSDALPGPDVHGSASRVVDAPLQMIMATARRELDALVQKQPPRVGGNALMRLYEPAIHIRASINLRGPLDSVRHTEALWGCLEAARHFFATYATIPLDMLGAMPLVATSYMAFAVVTSSMILLLDDPDWDVNLARKTFDFADACQSLGDRFREGDHVSQSLGRRQKFEDGGRSVLEANHRKILWIRHWYVSKISATASPQPRQASTENCALPMSSVVAEAPFAQPMQVDQPAFQDALQFPVDLDGEFWRAMLDIER
ncbi:hypothetical protein CCM_04658 [Cordyceps militaris CM01]|uniref:Fungal transcriptional regulatory protein n=1 Tax=Cordyceps militaris (strain CM01) TaxID=983644 RepID=G3JGL6_CORMM|nr:uncharacterized protein CCM_04658 [Cordyceps militaris CM01]EGX93285.1 hypothetical protein CCM_04658 [Cordyceps militaris CM01]